MTDWVEVVVVGSINHDLTVVASHHPSPGETVLGTDHFTGAGGKGANQAVAAARLGSAVAMVGRVGNDQFGQTLLHTLTGAGVEIGAVEIDNETPTGLAVITLDQAGENSIVVSPGANAGVDPDQVRRHRDLIAGATVCLAQMEIPPAAVSEAAKIGSGRFILNLAPAAPVAPEFLETVDVLVVNQTELATLTGTSDPGSMVGIRGPAAIVVTLGSEGAMFDGEGVTGHWMPPPVAVVDTTGAGDAFCGALAASLSAGRALDDAVRWAVAAGAIATTRAGAQTSMPDRAQVEGILERVRRA